MLRFTPTTPHNLEAPRCELFTSLLFALGLRPIVFPSFYSATTVYIKLVCAHNLYRSMVGKAFLPLHFEVQWHGMVVQFGFRCFAPHSYSVAIVQFPMALQV